MKRVLVSVYHFNKPKKKKKELRPRGRPEKSLCNIIPEKLPKSYKWTGFALEDDPDKIESNLKFLKNQMKSPLGGELSEQYARLKLVPDRVSEHPINRSILEKKPCLPIKKIISKSTDKEKTNIKKDLAYLQKYLHTLKIT